MSYNRNRMEEASRKRANAIREVYDEAASHLDVHDRIDSYFSMESDESFGSVTLGLETTDGRRVELGTHKGPPALHAAERRLAKALRLPRGG